MGNHRIRRLHSPVAKERRRSARQSVFPRPLTQPLLWTEKSGQRASDDPTGCGNAGALLCLEADNGFVRVSKAACFRMHSPQVNLMSLPTEQQQRNSRAGSNASVRNSSPETNRGWAFLSCLGLARRRNPDHLRYVSARVDLPKTARRNPRIVVSPSHSAPAIGRASFCRDLRPVTL